MTKTATNKGRHPLDSLDTGSKWVSALLDLFWEVDELMKSPDADKIPAPIQNAWERAEAARRKL